jgi:diguanylate cyclase (GGDEF)-like protein
LDNFRSFNNEYGYHKGDELIQLTGKLLGNVCHPKHDFIGHISGDQFTMILQSPDWELRCNRALAVFTQTSTTLFNKAHRNMGGYKSEDRQGRIIHHPLPTLSLGATCISPQQYLSHHKITDAANVAMEIAKTKPGNSLFIERREQHKFEGLGALYA